MPRDNLTPTADRIELCLLEIEVGFLREELERASRDGGSHDLDIPHIGAAERQRNTAKRDPGRPAPFVAWAPIQLHEPAPTLKDRTIANALTWYARQWECEQYAAVQARRAAAEAVCRLERWRAFGIAAGLFLFGIFLRALCGM